MYIMEIFYDISVYVKLATGNTVELNMTEPYSIRNAKQIISKKTGIHQRYQQLKFNGRVLEDGHTLDEYNVQYESTLELVVSQGSKYIADVSMEFAIEFLCLH